MTEADFEKPMEVSQLDMAFPAGDAYRKMMPPEDIIPKEFRLGSSGNKWVRMQSEWFFGGIKTASLKAKPGIDENLAIRHLKTLQGSFEPSHQHKVAAVSWLASKWFADWEESK